MIESNNLQEVIDFWQDKFVNMKTNDYFKRNLLHIAVACNVNLEIIEFLLQKNVPVNETDGSEGWSPLHWAVLESNIEGIDLLLAYGADINSNNNVIRWTPLHKAVTGNNIKVTELTERGADVNLKDIHGESPLQFARARGYKECVSIMEESYDIFLSYCWDDWKTVLRVYKNLKSEYKIWIDKTQIFGGEQLTDEIITGIENAKIFLAAISDKYENSSTCKKELLYAQNKKKIIIPICVQNYSPKNWLFFHINETIRIKYPNDGEENFQIYILTIKESIKTFINNAKTYRGTLMPFDSASAGGFGMEKIDDPELLYALKVSIEDQNGATSNREKFVDPSFMTEEEQIEYAMRMSLLEDAGDAEKENSQGAGEETAISLKQPECTNVKIRDVVDESKEEEKFDVVENPDLIDSVLEQMDD